MLLAFTAPEALDTARVGGKPWHYLLIPHDEITEALRLRDFLRFVQRG